MSDEIRDHRAAWDVLHALPRDPFDDTATSIRVVEQAILMARVDARRSVLEEVAGFLIANIGTSVDAVAGGDSAIVAFDVAAANARLIAAAPELLAALVSVTEHMDRAGGDRDGMPECPWCKRGPEDDGEHMADFVNRACTHIAGSTIGACPDCVDAALRPLVAEVRRLREKLEEANQAQVGRIIAAVNHPTYDQQYKRTLDREAELLEQLTTAESEVKRLQERLRIDSMAWRARAEEAERALTVSAKTIEGMPSSGPSIACVKCGGLDGMHTRRNCDGLPWTEALQVPPNSDREKPEPQRCQYCIDLYPRVSGKHFVDGAWMTSCPEWAPPPAASNDSSWSPTLSNTATGKMGEGGGTPPVDIGPIPDDWDGIACNAHDKAICAECAPPPAAPEAEPRALITDHAFRSCDRPAERCEWPGDCHVKDCGHPASVHTPAGRGGER